MADVSNIKLSPEQMEQKAGEFNQRCEDFNQVVSSMRTMVTTLCDEWAGQSSQAFYDQFGSLEPGFQATSELITSIAQQLRDVSAAMQSIDQEIAGKIGAM
ncbi:MAG: WXG100 family type VII secretion target [Lachnospiraceae bacterium]